MVRRQTDVIRTPFIHEGEPAGRSGVPRVSRNLIERGLQLRRKRASVRGVNHEPHPHSAWRVKLHLPVRQWADVDFERREVTWRAVWDKAGTERVTPMTKVSRTALLDCHQQRHSSAPWVFWNPYRPTQPLHYNGLHWHLRLAEARAGVPHKPTKRAPTGSGALC